MNSQSTELHQSIETEPGHSTPANSKPQKGFFHFWRCFWLLFLVVSLAYAWYCFYVPSNNIAWAKNYGEAQEKSVQSGKPVILYFTGAWCVPCRIMKRTVWADDEVAGIVNEHFVPVMLDVDDPDSAEAMRLYQVGGPPNTIIIDPLGNVLQHRGGGLAKPEFLQMLLASQP
ncbi:MAG: thioredoxin family protein [Aureliella sp.]